MNKLEFNKILASILLAGLVIMSISFFADLLYKPILQPHQKGYQVEGISSGPEAVAENKEITFSHADIVALMKTANADAGKSLFKKCSVCHTYEQNQPNRIGPNLWEIVNRAKASLTNYSYSAAMSSKGGNWDYESLFIFLHKPNKFVPGTKMSFIGFKNPQDIANMVEFLRTNASANPAPIPQE